MGVGRGKGHGTGSPVSFRCWACRSTLRGASDHAVTLTGKTRPYKPQRFTSWGARASDTERQYRCECGHVGWSNHKDLERIEGRTA